jgi:hypothetical protein
MFQGQKPKLLPQAPLPPQEPRDSLENLWNTLGIAKPRRPAMGNSKAVANRWEQHQRNERIREIEANRAARAEGIAPPIKLPKARSGVWVPPNVLQREAAEDAWKKEIDDFKKAYPNTDPRNVEDIVRRQLLEQHVKAGNVGALQQLHGVPSQIRWGSPQISSPPQEFRWGGEQFSLLGPESKHNLIELYPIVHSIYGSSVTIQAYKFFIDPLTLQSENEINNIIRSTIDNLIHLCKNKIRCYWLEDFNRNYPIEPIELYTYIFNWMHRNSFQDQIYTIFPEEISERIRILLFPLNARPAPFNADFKRKKIQYLRQLFQFPRGNPRYLLELLINNLEQRNEFERLLFNELVERENIIDSINLYIERLPDGVIKEDCEAFCYMLETTTSRFRMLNPAAEAAVAAPALAVAVPAVEAAPAVAAPALAVAAPAAPVAAPVAAPAAPVAAPVAAPAAPLAAVPPIFDLLNPFKINATSITNKFYLYFLTHPNYIDNNIIDRITNLNLIDKFTMNDISITRRLGNFQELTKGLRNLMNIFDVINNECLQYIEEHNKYKYIRVKEENKHFGGNKTMKNRRIKRPTRKH